MAKQTAGPSREILEAALHGLETQRNKLEEQIAEVRSILRKEGRSPSNPSHASASESSSAAPRKKRVLSAEARKRIAAAQKKRWAAVKKGRR